MTFTEGLRNAKKKFKFMQWFFCRVAWSSQNFWDGWLCNLEMTAKKSCTYGEYRSFEHLLFMVMKNFYTGCVTSVLWWNEKFPLHCWKLQSFPCLMWCRTSSVSYVFYCLLKKEMEIVCIFIASFGLFSIETRASAMYIWYICLVNC